MLVLFALGVKVWDTLHFASSVTLWVAFYDSKIAPTAGAICHFFCLFGKFCILPNRAHFSLHVFFAHACFASKNIMPFSFFAYFAFFLCAAEWRLRFSSQSSFQIYRKFYHLKQRPSRFCMFDHKIKQSFSSVAFQNFNTEFQWLT